MYFVQLFPVIHGETLISVFAFCNTRINSWRALLFTWLDVDLVQLKQSFGPSNEFLRSLKRTSHSDNKVIDDQDSVTALLQEPRFVGFPTYETNTAWGKEASNWRSQTWFLLIICLCRSTNTCTITDRFLVRFCGGRLLHRIHFALQRMEFCLLQSPKASIFGQLSH